MNKVKSLKLGSKLTTTKLNRSSETRFLFMLKYGCSIVVQEKKIPSSPSTTVDKWILVLLLLLSLKKPFSNVDSKILIKVDIFFFFSLSLSNGSLLDWDYISIENGKCKHCKQLILVLELSIEPLDLIAKSPTYI